jgi:two-component system NtrC family sensor kinase
LTLRVRVALLMVVAVAVLGGAIHLYLETRVLEELEGELEMRALGVARSLGSESVALILQQDLLALQRLLNDARKNEGDVVYAFAVDQTGHVLAHTFAGDFPADLRFLNRYHGREGFQVQHITVFGERFRDFAVPIYHGDLGVLRLGVRDRRILERVAAVRRELLLFLLGAAVASAGIAYLLTYSALKPLAAITTALGRFQPGKHREIIRPQRNDEVGDLAREINVITGRLHESQRQMMQTEKMAAAGLLASGIAHEINNPISGLQNCLRRIEARPDDADQVREYSALMLQATEHMAGVVRGLLEFSRSKPGEMRVIDLRHAVEKGLHLATLRFEKSRIEVRQLPPAEPVWVRGDEGQLVQVVVNLVLNAVDAMPAGGLLEVDMCLASSSVRLCFKDHGNGIPEEQLPRVFDPFYTTKGVGKGTGLGLAVTHSIVLDHGGSVEIQSRVGVGTEVTVELPVVTVDLEPGLEAT